MTIVSTKPKPELEKLIRRAAGEGLEAMAQHLGPDEQHNILSTTITAMLVVWVTQVSESNDDVLLKRIQTQLKLSRGNQKLAAMEVAGQA